MKQSACKAMTSTLRPLRLTRPAGEPAIFGAPLLIADTEALDVHLKGLAAALESDPLHENLVLADRGLARVAFLQRPWTAPDSRNVIVWQSAVAELLSDE
jgi:hypothetical protein